MLTKIYIEALLVDEELADQVWEAWDAGKADDETACIAWMLIAGVCSILVVENCFWRDVIYATCARHLSCDCLDCLG